MLDARSGNRRTSFPKPPDGGRAWRSRFTHDGGRSRLARRAHEGPLVVQKPLYPEGDGVCQCIVVHPPGGIAGGDRLALTVDVGPRAHAQLTTPGATKWYRSGGRPATQQHRAFASPTAPCSNGCRRERSSSTARDAASDVARRARARRRLYRVGRRLPRPHRVVGAFPATASGGSASTSCATMHSFGANARCCAASRRCCLRRVGLNDAPVFGTFVAMTATIRRLIARRLSTPCARARRRRRDATARRAGRPLPRRHRAKRRMTISPRCGRRCVRAWPAAPPYVRASGEPDGTDATREGQAPHLHGGAGRRAPPRRAGSGSTIRKRSR